MTPLRFRLIVVSLMMGAFVTMFIPGCSLGYLASLGYYQGKLLLSRVPVEEVLARPETSAHVRQQLELIQEVRTFGEETLKLRPTANYTSIALSWDHEIWNVTASLPLEFKSYTWWFPIVGRVPYKGFFQRAQGEAEERRLQQRGYETALRRVGGYSTLGWFKDPILPLMLDYPPETLANLVLHELAHATLFFKGQIDFNESFASFVADEATLRYLAARHGLGSAPLLETRARYADDDLFRQFMHELYQRLDAVYRRPLTDAEKQELKATELAEARLRYAALPFASRHFQRRAMPTLNNADILQYRRYSSAQADFARALERVDGDMSRFFEAMEALEGSDSPFEDLQRR